MANGVRFPRRKAPSKLKITRRSNGPDLKDLRKLIIFLRKNGISHYKSGEFELNLDKITTLSGKMKNTTDNATEGVPAGPFPSWDSLSQEQQLLWSSSQVPITTETDAKD